jgi:hypothetical protein
MDENKLFKHFEALRDNAYREYIDHCRVDECLGWEAIVDNGSFGLPELEAHKRAAECLGRHRAYARTVMDLQKILEKKA